MSRKRNNEGLDSNIQPFSIEDFFTLVRDVEKIVGEKTISNEIRLYTTKNLMQKGDEPLCQEKQLTSKYRPL